MMSDVVLFKLNSKEKADTRVIVLFNISWKLFVYLGSKLSE